MNTNPLLKNFSSKIQGNNLKISRKEKNNINEFTKCLCKCSCFRCKKTEDLIMEEPEIDKNTKNLKENNNFKINNMVLPKNFLEYIFVLSDLSMNR